ncbi:hypothetical protein BT96DRAFT_914098 [Gymnopus androsaceus JB14]|uniref:Uncharacterized protein n=1 Tax=Gymnopus androsaceus JB14 TaxID=1447944 RepID=A0A6A4IC06_9AGAR|nr:hypothetical protein BT96DRAFT_914098 [Gymnopus androsaceus JB14]
MTSEFERDPPPQYSEVVRSSSTSQPPRARTGSAGMYMQPSSSSPQPRSAESSTSGSRRSWFRRRFPSRASAGLGMHNPSSSSTSQSSIPDTYSKPTKIRTSAKHSLTSPGSGSGSSHSCSFLRRR